MISFLAIVKLTCRSAVRSHVFQFLLFLLLLGVFLVPNTIKGDGTPYSYIQVSLEYSLTFITVMLMLSGVWLGCQTMTADVEDCRLHLIVVKPISRYLVWLGKLTGVLVVLTTLLIIASAVVYGFILYQYSRQDFSKEERARMENEVLTGRRAYRPVLPDLREITMRVFQSKKNASGQLIANTLTGNERAKAIDSVYREVVASLAEIRPGQTRIWNYENLPENLAENSRFYVRYKAYSGSIEANQNQEHGYGSWGALFTWIEQPDTAALKPGQKPPEPQKRQAFLMKPPEQILCSAVNEFEMPAARVIVDGKASIGFQNLSRNGKNLFIQVADGPVIYVKYTSFADNYARAVFMMFLGIAAVVMIAVSVSSFLSFPTAIFFAIAYMLIGMFTSFLIGAEAAYGSVAAMPAMDQYGYYMSRIIEMTIIPVQKFGISGLVATGELIELSTIGSILLFQVILKGVPLALLGAWLYNRRELALAAIKR